MRNDIFVSMENKVIWLLDWPQSFFICIKTLAFFNGEKLTNCYKKILFITRKKFCVC